MCLCWGWGRCCKPSDDGSLLGPFRSHKRWTTDSPGFVHTHWAISVLTPRWIQTGGQHTPPRPAWELSWANWLFFVCFLKMKWMRQGGGRGYKSINFSKETSSGVSSVKGRRLASQQVGVPFNAHHNDGSSTRTTKRPIRDQWVHNHTHSLAESQCILPPFNYVEATTHWFLMYQVMTALQYFCRQLWGLTPRAHSSGLQTWQGRAGIMEEAVVVLTTVTATHGGQRLLAAEIWLKPACGLP